MYRHVREFEDSFGTTTCKNDKYIVLTCRTERYTLLREWNGAIDPELYEKVHLSLGTLNTVAASR